jgi:prevent-host-death family protein
MRTVNIHEAKTHLSRLVDEVARLGEPVVIARAGKPVAKVVPLDAPDTPGVQQRLGFLRGQLVIPDDFITMCEDEIIRMFNGDLPNDGWPEEAGPGPEGA